PRSDLPTHADGGSRGRRLASAPDRHRSAVDRRRPQMTDNPLPMPALLDELLRVDAPSGHEVPAAEVWSKAASFAELSSDGTGSVVARVGEESPLLAVFGHIDEIGMMVTYVDEKGFVWFAQVGGWDPQ